MNQTVPLRELACFDPLVPRVLLNAIDQSVAFMPMAAVLAENSVARTTQTRLTSEVSTGYTYFQTDDVLVAKITPCYENGKIALACIDTDHGFGTTEFHVIRTKPEQLNAKYLTHFLRQSWVVAEGRRKMTGSAGQRRVPRHFLEGLEVPLPPLYEQRRIAAILNQAEALRAKRRQVLATLHSTPGVLLEHLLKRERGSNVSEAWPSVPFPDVVHFQEGPGVRNWQFRDQGIKLVNVGNIVDGQLDTTNTSRFLDPNEVTKKYSHFLLDAGDYVMASSGVTWGKIAEVYEEHLPLCLNTSMIRLRPQNKRLSREFLRFYVESLGFRSQIDRLITGSAQPNFGPAHLKQVSIPLPPKHVQHAFAEGCRKPQP